MALVVQRLKLGLYVTLVAGAGGYVVLRLWRRFWLHRSRANYRRCRNEAQKHLQDALDDLAEYEEEAEDTELLRLDVEELLEKLRTGEIKCEKAVLVYLRKALACSSDRNINCVTSPVVGALQQAKECDNLLQSGQQPGLLHGLPVSIKENFAIAGMPSHWGIASQCGHCWQEDCVIVKILRSHGAVPFVKTNVPQSMFSFECSNPVYGVTLNPHNTSRGPGGSSGGEAALMALGGSLLGMGTDIAGSTRIPAAFCGVVGFKPTMGRISSRGSSTSVSGIVGVSRTAGPQAQSVAGCRLLMQALCCELMWRLDPTISPVPFNVQRCTQQRTLRIGYYDYDGFFPATPAYRRAVDEARVALESQGHELVPFSPPDVPKAIELYYSLVGADGGASLRDAMHYDDKDVSMSYLLRLAYFPRHIMSLLSPVIRVLWPRTGQSLCNVYPRSARQLWKLLVERQRYVSMFMDAWQHQRLDGVICPPHAMGAPPLGSCASMTCSFSYTMLFNLLDFPAGIVPVTKVTTEDELALRDHPHNNYWDALVAEKSVGSRGLPVCVQCATLPWQDETCLYLMQELETAVAKQRSQS